MEGMDSLQHLRRCESRPFLVSRTSVDRCLAHRLWSQLSRYTHSGCEEVKGHSLHLGVLEICQSHEYPSLLEFIERVL